MHNKYDLYNNSIKDREASLYMHVTYRYLKSAQKSVRFLYLLLYILNEYIMNKIYFECVYND